MGMVNSVPVAHSLGRSEWPSRPAPSPLFFMGQDSVGEMKRREGREGGGRERTGDQGQKTL